jgi:hypothetical protein
MINVPKGHVGLGLGSSAVEQSTHYPKVKGSDTDTDTGRKKKMKNVKATTPRPCGYFLRL